MVTVSAVIMRARALRLMRSIVTTAVVIGPDNRGSRLLFAYRVRSGTVDAAAREPDRATRHQTIEPVALVVSLPG